MSFESIKEIIENHAYETLVGHKEDPWLEAKSVPYDLENPLGRYELAKDVAAFANAGGGFIIVGLATEPVQDEQTDIVTALAPCAAASFEDHRYTSTIQEHIHPAIQNLRISWASTDEEQHVGLGIIEIPPQNTSRQYFLITKMIEDGVKLKQIVFGIARRNGASNEPFTPEQLYRYTQDGKSPTAQILTRMNEKLDALLANAHQPEEVDPEDFYGERTAEILDET